MELRLRFQPKQEQLLDLLEGSVASWIGYGGARGGGKSGAVRRAMLARRLANPGTWGIIVRRVYDDLKQNHIDKFWLEWPELEQFYDRTNKEIVLPTDGEPSKIIFGYAETAADVERKFHGPEYQDIFVDQAEQFTEGELRKIKLANRWPGIADHQSKLVLFFNPGGIGLEFLKRVFHDQKYLGDERPESYAFIQAYGWDNVEWSRDALRSDGLSERDYYSWPDATRFEYFITRSQYGRELNELPPALRVGHLMGSFDVFAGQYFGPVWNEHKAVVEIDQALALIRPWWPKWISIDWGFAHHTSVHWHARGEVTPEQAKKILGRTWSKTYQVTVTYRGLVKSEMAERALGEEIVARTDETERGEIRRVFLSPDAFAKRTTKNTIAQEIGDVLKAHGLPRPERADNDRVGGWRLMYNELKETFDSGVVAVA